MLIYARVAHRYHDLGKKTSYWFPERGWTEVPDPIGRIVLEGHPTKLVNITDEPDPNEATARLNDATPAPEPVATVAPVQPARRKKRKV